MRIDLSGLDATIQKLQELRRLASDPALAPFVQLDEHEQAILPAKNGTASYESELGTAILLKCSDLQESFTVAQIYELLKSDGYPFAGTEPKKSIGNVLRALARDGHIKEVQKGRGRRPTKYAI